MKLYKKNILYVSFIIFVFFLDFISKILVVKYLKPIGTFKLIDGVFQLSYRENRGAAFSFLDGQVVFFIIITSVFILALLVLLFSNKVTNMFASFCIAGIIGGGLGNLYSRIFDGFVVDMFDFCLINFAVFNVADIFITCGSILVIILYIIKKGDIVKWK